MLPCDLLRRLGEGGDGGVAQGGGGRISPDRLENGDRQTSKGRTRRSVCSR